MKILLKKGLSTLFLATLCGMLVASCMPQEDTDQRGQLRWFKGNLHTHSLWSDGDEFPEPIMRWYKDEGYHFLALSDHNILAIGEKWIEFSPDDTVFQAYLNQYGDQWVDFEEDSSFVRVRLKTLTEYRPLFEEPEKFLILQAEEITDHFQNRPVHLNATNVKRLIAPQGGSSVADVLQQNINAVLHQRDSTGEPMLVHINHPNYQFAITLEDMIALQGEQFFEVFNGHPYVYNLGDSTHISTETMWDLINIAYVKRGQPLLYGLATDDSHHYHQQGSEWSNAGRGWIQVLADTLSVHALLEAMEAGHFYASTGVTLNKVSYEDQELVVEVAAEPGVDYQLEFIGCQRKDSVTRVLQSQSGTRAQLPITSQHLFVRCRVTSSKTLRNPTESFKYETAWTQPVLF